MENLNAKQEEIQKIAEEVFELVVRNTQEKVVNDNKYQSHYLEIMGELDIEIESTKEWLKDLKEDNLTIGAIELEGYLRALLFMTRRFKDWESSL